jgi:hypothetical protein
MHLPATVNNKRLVRLIWWIACIPFEIVRLPILLPVTLIRKLTERKFCILWTIALASMLAYSPETFMNYTAYYALYGGFALGGICRMFPRLILTLFPYPKAFWRLSPRSSPLPKPTPPREIISSVVVASHTNPQQTRAVMTARLSPALQALLQKGMSET